MTILHIIPSFAPAWSYGGSVQSAYFLCMELARNGNLVRVLTTNSNGLGKDLTITPDCEHELVKRLQVRYCRRLLRHSISFSFLKALPSYLRQAQVVHLTGVYSFPTLPVLFLCQQWGIPVVWSPRGGFQRWSGSRRVWLKSGWEIFCKILLPKNLTLHLTSDGEATESLEKFPGVSTSVIPNGVEIPEALHHTKENGVLRLLYLGRLDKKKGIENLLLACHRLKEKQQQSFKLTIAGEGLESYALSLRKLASAHGLNPHVNFVGHVDNKQKRSLFEQTDLTIVPSYTENFGIVVAESLSYGIPVVASTGTPWKRMEEIGCGLWVSNDPDSLSQALAHMSSMNLSEMGLRGRLWMEQEFSWGAIAKRMGDLYERHISA
ncbi:MAG: hypothetical protein NPIRA01_04800 [Nitrospirales bacterium]|nr:MAG: hypothetical protein NPIRA01_04800 [Nitrospirales bacterium]